MENLKKILKLNTWSWVALFGYLEIITLAIVILTMINGDPSGALGYLLLCILLGMIYLILPIILFIQELCGKTIRKIIKNKVIFVIGVVIHILLVGYCLLCYIILNIHEHRPFVFVFLF